MNNFKVRINYTEKNEQKCFIFVSSATTQKSAIYNALEQLNDNIIIKKIKIHVYTGKEQQ